VRAHSESRNWQPPTSGSIPVSFATAGEVRQEAMGLLAGGYAPAADYRPQPQH
jgi:hypothetical protein